MNKGIVAIIIIAIVVIGAGVLLWKNSSAPSSQTPSTTDNMNMAPATTNDTTQSTSGGGTSVDVGVSAGTGSVKEFTVTGQNFSFSPSTITVNKGDDVKITFKNSGGNHDFHIDEFNVATAVIGSGQSQTVEFTADKTGSFQYYCSVGSHRAMGMWGTLTVK